MNDVIERELDITPLTGVLERERNSQLGWKRAVAELVDNSFDAQATQVRIEFGHRTFSITDDGCGARDIQAMLRFGDHRKNTKECVGRYGVGTKLAAVWAWGKTTIASTRDGRVATVRVDWEQIERSGKWKVSESAFAATDKACRSVGAPLGHGTQIKFEQHSRKLPSIDELARELSYRFSPAISQGRQIRIRHPRKKGDLIVPEFRKPALEFVIDKEIEVEGKLARVLAGVLPAGQPNPLPGFTYAHRHRVIATNNFGCGEFTHDRFFGWVELIGDGWRLSVTKDAISEGGDALYESLEATCHEQLSRASMESRDVELAGLEQNISTALSNALCEQQKTKAKRSPPIKATGTVDGPGEREHKKAEKLQAGSKSILGPCPEAGDTAMKRVGDKIKVSFSNELGKEVIGSIAANDKCVHVTLYLDHPAVRWAARERNQSGLSMLTASMVAMFAATEPLTDKRRRRLLPFMSDDMQLREMLIRALSAYTTSVKEKCNQEVEVEA